MFEIRKGVDRGYVDRGWLESWFSFSFAEYMDRSRMHFGSIRVINEDIIQPGQGFGTHPHDNMEIFTYILSGELEHRDSMGNGRIIRAGELQAMSAGSGITHSEFNPSPTEECHLLQIWLLPNARNITPRYEEWRPSDHDAKEILLVSPDRDQGSMLVHQDARISLLQLQFGDVYRLNLSAERQSYIHCIDGAATVGTFDVLHGDAVTTIHETAIEITPTAPTKFLVFDLAID